MRLIAANFRKTDRNPNRMRPELLLMAVLFLLCLYALHDMQTAEGIGLFLALQIGLKDCIWMNLLVDILGTICLALLIYMPCHFTCRRGESYVRLFVGYLAVVPHLSLAEMIHVCQGEKRFLWETNVSESLTQWFLPVEEFLQIWVPLLVLTYLLKVYVAEDIKKDEGNVSRERKCEMQWKILGLQAVLLVFALLIPSALNPLMWLVGYMGLILAFDYWETVLANNRILEKWSRIPFALLLLRGIYRIMILVSRM